MKNNLSDNFFSSINYDTYQNILDTVQGIGISSCIMTIFTNKPLIFFPIELVAFALYVYHIFNYEKEYLTKDITEIKKLYQEFINNYTKLNETFELDNPIKIYTMFTYLYSNGYLSQSKSFEFSGEGVKDMTPIMGANVLVGKGVCRHVSTLFADILHNQDIDVSQLICIMHDKGFLERTFGNHTICLVQKDGVNYFLDPTNMCILKMEDGILYEQSIPLKVKKKNIMYKALKYSTPKNFDDGDILPKEDEKKFIFETKNICKNNIDIFENFYNENKDLYVDISNKLTRIKRK